MQNIEEEPSIIKPVIEGNENVARIKRLSVPPINKMKRDISSRLFASYAESKVIIPNHLTLPEKIKNRILSNLNEAKSVINSSGVKPKYRIHRQSSSISNISKSITTPVPPKQPGDSLELSSISHLISPLSLRENTSKRKISQSEIIASARREIQNLELLEQNSLNLEKNNLTISSKVKKVPKLKHTELMNILNGKMPNANFRIEFEEFIELLENSQEYADGFSYCLRDKEEFYKFYVVPFSEIIKISKNLLKGKKNIDYITISRRGITHFYKNEATFMSINKFMRDVTNYRNMKKIKFFALSSICKCFFLWKKRVKKTKMSERIEFLSKYLIVTDPILGQALIDARCFINKQSTIDLIPPTQDEAYQHSQFIEARKENTKNMEQTIHDIDDQIKKVILNACSKSTDIYKKSRVGGHEKAEGEGENFLFGDETHKAMPYTQEAALRSHYKQLARFIKLIDAMNQESKLSIIENTYNRCINLLANDVINIGRYSKNRNVLPPLLQIEVLYENENLNFQPSFKEVLDLLKFTLKQGLNFLCDLPDLKNEEKFMIFLNSLKMRTDKIEEEKTSILTFISTNEEFNEKQEKIDDFLKIAYKRVMDYSSSLRPLIDIVKDNLSRNFDYLRNSPAEEFKTWMRDFSRQINEVSDQPDIIQIGIFSLNCTTLKKITKNFPSSNLIELKAFIPKYTLEKITEVSLNLISINEKLSDEKNDLETLTLPAYVEFKHFVKKSRLELFNLLDLVNKCSDIHQFSLEMRCVIPPMNKTKLTEVLQKIQLVKKKAEEKYDKIERLEPKYKKELEKLYPKTLLKLTAILKMLKEDKFYETQSDTNSNVEELSKINDLIKAEKDVNDKLQYYSESFEIERSPPDEVEEVQNKFEKINRLWATKKEFLQRLSTWSSIQFLQVDSENIGMEAENYLSVVNNLYDIFRESFPSEKVPEELMILIRNALATAECINSLKCSHLEENHWKEIYSTLGFAFDKNDATMTFKVFLDKSIFKHKQALIDIAAKANKEKQIEEKHNKIIENLKKIQFTMKTLSKEKDKKEEQFLGNKSILLKQYEETILALDKILSNRHINPIRKKVLDTYLNVALSKEILEEWIYVQKIWKCYDSLFKSDLQNIHLKEYQTFQKIDSEFKNFSKNPDDYFYRGKKFFADRARNTIDSLTKAHRVLDDITKNIEEFLSIKRSECPRYYLITNEDLIYILSDLKNIDRVLPHITKMFPSIKGLEYWDETKEETSAVIGFNKEKLQIKVSTKPADKNFSLLLESKIKEFLQQNIKSCYHYFFDDFFNRKDFIKKSCSQVILLIARINHSYSTDLVLEEEEGMDDNLNTWYDEIVQTISETVLLMKDPSMNDNIITMSGLITQDLHFRDTIQVIINQVIRNVNNLGWQQNMRFYFIPENNHVVVRQFDTTIDYFYEYYSPSIRLMQTPISDKCFLSISTALRNQIGSIICGNLGTGKTQIMNELGYLLGKFINYFYFDQNTSYKSIIMNIKGAVTIGGINLFYNITEASKMIISFLSQTLHKIRNAFKLNIKPDSIYVNNEDIKLIHNLQPIIGNSPPFSMIGITSSYQKLFLLPPCFRNLFRPISLANQDIITLSKDILFIYGFREIEELANLIDTFKLNLILKLPSKPTYIFGFKLIRDIIIEAHNQKQKGEKNETECMRKSFIINFEKKILKEDMGQFKLIIKEMFIQIDDYMKVPLENCKLTQYIKSSFEKIMLIPSEIQISQCETLYELICHYHGIILIGEPLSGKSTIIKLLENAINEKELNIAKQGNTEETIQTNRLSITQIFQKSNVEILGKFTKMNNEWKDGILPKLIQQLPKRNLLMKWIILNGPIDVIISDKLSTMTFERPFLSVPNGEVIKLSDKIKIFYETDNLQNSSPSFISKLGILSLIQNNVGPECIIKQKLKEFKNKKKEIINDEIMQFFCSQIDKLFYKLLDTRSTINIEYINSNKNNQALNFMKLFDILYSREYGINPGMSIEERKKTGFRYLIYSLGWSICGNLDLKNMKKIEAQMNQEGSNEIPKDLIMNTIIKIEGSQMGEYELIENLPFNFKFDEKNSYSDIFFLNKSHYKFLYVLKILLSSKINIIFSGGQGSGKSALSTYVITELIKQNRCEIISKCFSKFTKCHDLEQLLDSKLEKRRKGLLGGHKGSHAIIFLDDINLPKTDKYSNQKLTEFLREIFSLNGFYDSSKFFWKSLADSSFLCNARFPQSSHYELNRRLCQNSFLISIASSQTDLFTSIYENVLLSYLESGFSSEISLLGNSLLLVTYNLFEAFGNELFPTPENPHLIFSLHEISGIFQGLFLYQKKLIKNAAEFIKLYMHEIFRSFQDKALNYHTKKLISDIIIRTFESILKGNYKYVQGTDDKPLLFKFPNILKDSNSIQKSGIETDIKDISELLNQAQKKLLQEDENSAFIISNESVINIAKFIRAFNLNKKHIMSVSEYDFNHLSLYKIASYIVGSKIISLPSSNKISEIKEFIEENIIQAGKGKINPVIYISESQLNSPKIRDLFGIYLNPYFALTNFTYEKIISIFEPEKKGEKDKLKEKDKEYEKEKEFEKEISPNFQEQCVAFFQKAFRSFHFAFSICNLDKFRNLVLDCPSLISSCIIIYIPPSSSENQTNQMRISIKNEFKDIIIEDEIKWLAEIALKIDLSIKYEIKRIKKEQGINMFYSSEGINVFISKCFSHYLKFSNLNNEKYSKLQKCLDALEGLNKDTAKYEEEMANLRGQGQAKDSEFEALNKLFNKEKIEKDRETNLYESDLSKFKDRFAVGTIDDEKLIEAKELYTGSQNSLKQLSDNLNFITQLKTIDKANKSLVNTLLYYTNIIIGQEIDEKKAITTISGEFVKKVSNFNIKNLSFDLAKKIKDRMKKASKIDSNKLASINSIALALFGFVTSSIRIVFQTDKLQPKASNFDQKEFILWKNKLLEKKRKLLEINASFQELENKLNELKIIREALQTKMARTERFLQNSFRISKDFLPNKEKWESDLKYIETRKQKVMGDSIMHASSISYLGPFDVESRKLLINNWMKACKSYGIECFQEKVHVHNCLTFNTCNFEQWKIIGMCLDDHLMDSLVILDHYIETKTPLIIDPSDFMRKWIVSKLDKFGKSSSKVVQLKQTDILVLNQLNRSIKLGETVFFVDMVGNVSPIIEQVILNEYTDENKKKFIKLDKEIIEKHVYFKIYLFTQSLKMFTSSFVFQNCNIVDCSLSLDTIKQILILAFAQKDDPGCEGKIQELNKLYNENYEAYNNYRKEMIERLVNLKMPLIEDSSTIDFITQNSKDEKTAFDQFTHISDERETFKNQRNRYNFIALSITEIIENQIIVSQLNQLYDFQFNNIMRIIKNIIDISQTPLFLKNLEASIRQVLFDFIYPSLFDIDKTLFAILCTTKHGIRNDKITFEELQILLGDSKSIQVADENEMPKSEVITQEMWEIFYNLNIKCIHLTGLLDDVKENLKSWEEWIKSYDVIHGNLPVTFANKTTNFGKAILLKYLFPLKTRYIYDWLNEEELGKENIIIDYNLYLSRAFPQSSFNTPLICIHKSDYDPLRDLVEYLNSLKKAPDKEKDKDKMSDQEKPPNFEEVKKQDNEHKEQKKQDRLESHYTIISALNNNEKQMLSEIEDAKAHGKILILANAQYDESWIYTLSDKIDMQNNKDKKKGVENLKLIITCCDSLLIPTWLQGNCSKIALESKDGFKQGMKQNLKIVSKYFENNSNIEFMRSCFGICMLHAMLKGRVKFEEAAWNYPYLFPEIDVKLGTFSLFNITKKYSKIDYYYLKEFISDILFGNTITDEFDLLQMRYLTYKYVNEAVLKGNYSFTTSKVYKMPQRDSINDYIRCVEAFPNEEETDLYYIPDTFKMIVKEKNHNDFNSRIIILNNVKKLKSLKTGEFESKFQSIYQKCLTLLSERLIAEPKAEMMEKTKGYMDPFTQTLLVEVSKYNSIVEYFMSCLVTLSKALKCQIYFDDNFKEMYEDIMNDKVPKIWMKNMYVTNMSFLDLIQNFKMQYEYFQNWLKNGHPKCYEISKFFLPHSLLFAFKQKISRKYNSNLIGFTYNFQFEKTKDPSKIEQFDEDSLYINKIYIERARIDEESGNLVENVANSVSTEVPIMKISYQEGESNDENFYKCPLYRCKTKEVLFGIDGFDYNLILKINCKSEIDEGYWINKKVFMLLEQYF